MKLMKPWLISIVAAVVCVAAEPPVVTLTGTVGDDMCAGDHKKMGGTDAMKCTEECIKGMGAKLALIVGHDVYELSDQKAAAKYVGKKVTVKGEVTTETKGTLTTKSLQVKSISAVK